MRKPDGSLTRLFPSIPSATPLAPLPRGVVPGSCGHWEPTTKRPASPYPGLRRGGGAAAGAGAVLPRLFFTCLPEMPAVLLALGWVFLNIPVRLVCPGIMPSGCCRAGFPPGRPSRPDTWSASEELPWEPGTAQPSQVKGGASRQWGLVAVQSPVCPAAGSWGLPPGLQLSGCGESGPTGLTGS